MTKKELFQELELNRIQIQKHLNQAFQCFKIPKKDLEKINDTTRKLSEEIIKSGIKAAESLLKSQKKKPSKPDSVESPGSRVWFSYVSSYVRRWNNKPLRNAMTNGQAKQLVGRVGINDAIKLVDFYCQQNDMFYVKSLHPLGLCLKDAESLYTRMKTRQTMTTQKARTTEEMGAGAHATRSYLDKKRGNTK